MSNKSRKNKSSQSPKQEPERASEKAMRESEPEKQTDYETFYNEEGKKPKVSTPSQQDPKTRMQDVDFSFETKAAEVKNAIIQIVDGLQSVADILNTETIFGITAARFQAYADKIGKYPKQLENKAKKERRLLTQTETKEEKKEKRAKTLRDKIKALQTKLAKL